MSGKKMEEIFGNTPFPPDKKRAVVIKEDMIEHMVFPAENPYFSDFTRMMVSTDKLSFGTFRLSPGAKYDIPDVHPSDEIYYIIKGTLTELNPETGECYEIKEGESLLIPKGAYHLGYNFTKEELVIIFAVAPIIWSNNIPTKEYKGKFRVYKS